MQVMRSSINDYLCALAISDIVVILTALHLYWVLSIECAGVWAVYLYNYLVPVFYPLSLNAQTMSVYFVVVAAIDCFVSVVCGARIRCIVR